MPHARTFFHALMQQVLDLAGRNVGKPQDQDLELAFRRICGGDNFSGVEMPFDPVICDKKSNAIGLQLADLVARPIGMRQLRPDQPNRAWDVIEQKLDKDATGRYLGYGLKCFP
ncbi:DUF3800 domain-containing protein [Xanthomonas oryzae pv. oryzae]|nr:DUF3800 domain-containing protein [Xanthomonas oryzae pv. oryzae]QBO04097.1 DUF3800 domain-containing protein [Xanthomonas oryzae pv. oryzae]